MRTSFLKSFSSLWLPFIVDYLNMAGFVLVLTCTHCGSLEEAWLFLHRGDQRLRLGSKSLSWRGMTLSIKCLWTARIRLLATPFAANTLYFFNLPQENLPPSVSLPGLPCCIRYTALTWSWSSAVAAELAWGAARLERAGESGCCSPAQQLLLSLGCPVQLRVASSSWSTSVGTRQVLTASGTSSGWEELCSGCEMWECFIPVCLRAWWCFCCPAGGGHGFQSLQRSVLAAHLCAQGSAAELLGTSRERDDISAISVLPGTVCDKSRVSEWAPEQGWLVLRLFSFCGESVLQSVPLMVILCWLNEAACVSAAELLQVPFSTVCFCRSRTRCLIPARSTGQCLIPSCRCTRVCTASLNQHWTALHLLPLLQ